MVSNHILYLVTSGLANRYRALNISLRISNPYNLKYLICLLIFLNMMHQAYGVFLTLVIFILRRMLHTC